MSSIISKPIHKPKQSTGYSSNIRNSVVAIAALFLISVSGLSVATDTTSEINTANSESSTTSANQVSEEIGEVEITNAWLRPSPPNAQVGGGFVTIENLSDKDDVLLKFDSTTAVDHELHNVAMKDGMMNMVQLEDGITIPANSAFVLKPMDNHLMFLKLLTSYKPGETYNVSMYFKNAGRKEVTFTVKTLEEAQKLSM